MDAGSPPNFIPFLFGIHQVSCTSSSPPLQTCRVTRRRAVYIERFAPPVSRHFRSVRASLHEALVTELHSRASLLLRLRQSRQFSSIGCKKEKPKSKSRPNRAQSGIEPETSHIFVCLCPSKGGLSPSRSANHTTRPLSRLSLGGGFSPAYGLIADCGGASSRTPPLLRWACLSLSYVRVIL